MTVTDPLADLDIDEETRAYLTPPPDISPAAHDLWQRHLANLIADEKMPSPAEHRLLTEAAENITLTDDLAAAVREAGGFTVPGTRGAERSNPLLLDLDRARKTTALLLKQLGARPAAEASRVNGGGRPR